MNDYSDKIQNMVWSYSRVTEYDNCPYSFYLKYIIDNDEEYLAEGNFYAEVGKFVHKILEKIFTGELDADDALEYYMNNFDDNVIYTTRQSVMDSSYELCADYFASVKFDWLKDYDILGVEQKINITVGRYIFTGYIDLILRHKTTKEIHIIDHKSAKYPFKKDGKTLLKKSEDSFKKYKLQMYLYSKYIYDTYGEYPKWIEWNHFKDQKIAKIPFDIDEYEAAIQWFIWQIVNIENDEEFQANVNYFYCNNLCDFRASCEYNQDEQ